MTTTAITIIYAFYALRYTHHVTDSLIRKLIYITPSTAVIFATATSTTTSTYLYYYFNHDHHNARLIGILKMVGILLE